MRHLPPKSLGPESKKLWTAIVREYRIDDPAGLVTLQVACQAYDRFLEAQAILDKEGLVVEDRTGKPKQHPATFIERDARTAFLRALSALNLAVAPAEAVGAPLAKY